MTPRCPHAARAALAIISIAFAALLFTTCGGGGGGGSGPPPAPLAISTAPLSDGITGVNYIETLVATGGKPPYTWTVASGTMPPGTGLSSLLGSISGTASEAGTFEFTAEVRDSSSRSAQAALRIRIADPLLVTSNVFYLSFNQPANRSIQATGGVPPYSWTLSDGTMQSGLSLTADGAITGTPTESGHRTVAITVIDSGSPPQTNRFSLTVFVLEHVTILTGGLPSGVATHPYQTQLEAAGGIEPYGWRLIGGGLPEGLSLHPSGEIRGTSPVPAYSDFTVEVSDSSIPPQVASTTKSVGIIPTVEFLTSYAFPDGVKDGGYLEYLTVRYGQPPYHVVVDSGGLPPGLYIQSSADVSMSGNFQVLGSPTATGTYSFNVSVTDSSTPPDTARREGSIRINEPLVMLTTSLPVAWTEQFYTVTLTARGGTPPYSWSAQPLPLGLVMDPESGRISGTPLETFDSELSIWVFDQSSPPQYVYIHPPFRVIGKLYITSSKLPSARSSVPYRVSLGMKGGTAPFSWTVSSGALPNGLVLGASSGQITGTPTTDGLFDFTLRLADSSPPPQSTTKPMSITITSDLGRNDSPATATPISNGTFRASISPYADPVAGPANPDNDYYALSASPSAVVTIETTARRLVPPSYLDSVIEIVDADGNRLSTCRIFTYDQYDQPCLNDDINLGVLQDSHLEFKAPTEGTLPITFYVRVFSFNGSARPDYVYDLTVSGAN